MDVAGVPAVRVPGAQPAGNAALQLVYDLRAAAQEPGVLVLVHLQTSKSCDGCLLTGASQSAGNRQSLSEGLKQKTSLVLLCSLIVSEVMHTPWTSAKQRCGEGEAAQNIKYLNPFSIFCLSQKSAAIECVWNVLDS